MVVVVVGGGAVVVVAGALVVVDAPAVTVGVTGAVVETPGLEVDDAAGSDVVDSPGCVVVELTDGRVGRLPPEPPQAASPSTATKDTASTTARHGMHPFTESGAISICPPPSVPLGDEPAVASVPDASSRILRFAASVDSRGTAGLPEGCSRRLQRRLFSFTCPP